MNASQQIDTQIAELTDWRGPMLARLRKLVGDAAPELTEDWKWGNAVWTHNGNVVSTGAFKDHVKINFFKGASLGDPKRLFNAGLDAKVSRSIDFAEDANIDVASLKDLIRSAVTLNASAKKR